MIKPKYSVGQILIHVKSSGTYVILIDATQGRLEATGEPAYGYQREDGTDHRIWFRSQKEMEDGRFEVIDALPPPVLLNP